MILSNNSSPIIRRNKYVEEREIIENNLAGEINDFLERRRKVREKLISDNYKLKNLYFPEFQSKKNDMNMNMNSSQLTLKESLNQSVSETLQGEIIPLSTLFIPKGIFVYPCKENIRTNEEYEIIHMPLIDNFNKFEEILENVENSMHEWFADYPHNKDSSERIDNHMYIVWVWIKSLLEINSKFTLLENSHYDLIEILAEKVSKKFTTLCKHLSKFLTGKIKKLKKGKVATISKYRQAYCQICFKYVCKVHFYKYYHFSNVKGAKFYKVELKKNSGKMKYKCISQYINQKVNTQIEKFYFCPLITDCKHNYEMINGVFNNLTAEPNCRAFSIHNSQEENNDYNKEHNLNHSSQDTVEVCLYDDNNHQLFDQIRDIYDFYLLNCLVASSVCFNSCFISHFIFRGKYKCHILDKIISILQDQLMVKTIDDYLQKRSKKGDNNREFIALPLVSEDRLLPNYVTDIPYNMKKGKGGNNTGLLNPHPAYSSSKSKCEYVPCSHPGLCRKDCCECIAKRGYCDKFCNCKDYCEMKFKGCECRDDCSNEDKCPCLVELRECDPDTCRTCGASSNYHSKEEYNLLSKKHKLCRNMSISFGLSKKTCLSKSLLCDYYGLFALEDIDENDFVCEYNGELLFKEESDRRNIFKDFLGLNYLFGLSEYTDIDAYRVGSKMRYVNHSSFGYQNCYARGVFVRGNYRIALYASRKISRGEELFFDYMLKVKVPWIIKYNRYYAIK